MKTPLIKQPLPSKWRLKMDELSGIPAQVPTEDSGITPHKTPVAFNTDLARLPQIIGVAVVQSGILEQGDLSWLNSPRVINCLFFANEAHYGKTRKNGDENRLIHEIWCAHKIYNDADLTAWLHDQNIPREWAVIGAILHDQIENRRDQAEKEGVAFDQHHVLSSIEKLVDDKPLFDFLVTYCFDYMTDAPGLHKKERIQAQKDKSYRNEKCIITPLQQYWRLYDKLSHVVLDARFCLNTLQKLAAKLAAEEIEINRQIQCEELHEKAADHLRLEFNKKVKNLKTIARKALQKASLKSFVFLFPVANDNHRTENSNAMALLKKFGGSLSVDLMRSFRASGVSSVLPTGPMPDRSISRSDSNFDAAQP